MPRIEEEVDEKGDGAPNTPVELPPKIEADEKGDDGDPNAPEELPQKECGAPNTPFELPPKGDDGGDEIIEGGFLNTPAELLTNGD